ncbi:PTS sugar transporter subunit IIA [Nitrosomonas sp. Nm166]|uniref:PTS sugar transporter subunit IIA n=1 Tax=Nitrosomonas sp. Nm166 TaxID=1881054 RepID=UPI0008F072FB|nr:PTS fructose transporter subunit IIA [Nitrosomonas sp. Nm166]SFE72203.1 PTS system, ascorbate-specific IIA component [Nitrosomonas sp. Nm166]
MIGILVLTHEDLGDHLIRCASHVVGMKPPQLIHLSVFPQDDPDIVLSRARALIKQLDGGDGVLILSDILGATPCNIASRLVQPGKVECVTGVNLPMLVRVLTYRNEPLSVVLEKGLSGGQDGVVHI